MIFPAGTSIPTASETLHITPLTCSDAPAMVALTDLAFPGFFRARTCLMGAYYGIWSGEELIAMAGERMCPFPFREISGVCTHPDHRGQGYAALLIANLLDNHRRTGAVSALHVAAANQRAIELYLRLGFVRMREVQLHRLKRSDFG